MSTTLTRLGAAAAVAVAALLPVSGADAAEFCGDHLYIYSVNAPGFVNCVITNTGELVTRVGGCTSAYQPLSPPFGTNVVPQTQAYVGCVY